MYNANLTIIIKDIPGNSEDEAKKWLKEYFNELAGSNDGSEYLANLINDLSRCGNLDIHKQGESR